MRERLCLKPPFGAGDGGPAPAPAENDVLEKLGPERFSGLRIPSFKDAVDEFMDAFPNSDSGFVLRGDSYPDAVGVEGKESKSGLGAGGCTSVGEGAMGEGSFGTGAESMGPGCGAGCGGLGKIEAGFAVSNEGVDAREVVRRESKGRCEVVDVGVGIAEVSSSRG